MQNEIKSERKRLLRSVDQILEGPMILMGFVWLALLVAELVWGINKTLEYVTLGILGVFVISIIVRFVLAPEKLPF